MVWLLKRFPDEDNRFNNVTITEKGKKIVKESQKVFQNTDDVMFKDFTEEEILQLEGFMDRIQKKFVRCIIKRYTRLSCILR